jgi:hypothetical protein
MHALTQTNYSSVYTLIIIIIIIMTTTITIIMSSNVQQSRLIAHSEKKQDLYNSLYQKAHLNPQEQTVREKRGQGYQYLCHLCLDIFFRYY